MFKVIHSKLFVQGNALGISFMQVTKIAFFVVTFSQKNHALTNISQIKIFEELCFMWGIH